MTRKVIRMLCNSQLFLCLFRWRFIICATRIILTEQTIPSCRTRQASTFGTIWCLVGIIFVYNAHAILLYICHGHFHNVYLMRCWYEHFPQSDRAPTPATVKIKQKRFQFTQKSYNGEPTPTTRRGNCVVVWFIVMRD